ncbi:MAG: GNAT family N-acetyltransferase [Spirochaetales bacterium]|nr:GNAT family N-acetyltransferase [Spirochaetales bacterium]
MLDKSLPYFNILLMRKQKTDFERPPLPEGFHFEFFQRGDEEDWADIETSVLEFSHQKEALEYFKKEYLIYGKDLSDRCIFVSTEQGRKVGTATAWWSTRHRSRVPSLHWISIIPEYQKRGLGKALVSKALDMSLRLDGDLDSFIHTQTWSYPAIGIYLNSGYKILRNGTFAHFQNDYEKALPYLKEKMGKRFSPEKHTTSLS